jgi:hypothetical protein
VSGLKFRWGFWRGRMTKTNNNRSVKILVAPNNLLIGEGSYLDNTITMAFNSITIQGDQRPLSMGGYLYTANFIAGSSIVVQ